MRSIGQRRFIEVVMTWLGYDDPPPPTPPLLPEDWTPSFHDPRMTDKQIEDQQEAALRRDEDATTGFMLSLTCSAIRDGSIPDERWADWGATRADAQLLLDQTCARLGY